MAFLGIRALFCKVFIPSKTSKIPSSDSIVPHCNTKIVPLKSIQLEIFFLFTLFFKYDDLGLFWWRMMNGLFFGDDD